MPLRRLLRMEQFVRMEVLAAMAFASLARLCAKHVQPAHPMTALYVGQGMSR